MKPIRRILVASDFSKSSRRAFAAALALSKSKGASLTIVYVNVPLVPIVPEQYVRESTWNRLNTEARRWNERQLAKLAERAKQAGVKVATVLVNGDPPSEIVRAARSRRADLVVLGTHGRTGFSKFLLGSVAERVIATARCPVMTVRG